MIARTQVFQSRFSAPGLGGQHVYVEIQWHQLQRSVRRVGRPRCIALGNSQVWGGFDPVAFNLAFQEQTGSELACYNFGIDGLPASAAGVLAEILVKDLQPALLIYGIDSRDFSVPGDALDATAVLDMPWVRYRAGEFSLDGWLYAHSSLYGYRRHLRHLLRLNYSDAQPRPVERRVAAHFGFNPDEAVGAFVSSPPEARQAEGQVAYYFSVLSAYQVRPENLAGLEQVLQLSDRTQVIVVTMPVPATYFDFFDNPEVDYQRFLDAVGSQTAAYGVPLWTSTPKLQIPLEGWMDYSHLNAGGAQVFSTWFGQQVGTAVAQAVIPDPSQ